MIRTPLIAAGLFVLVTSSWAAGPAKQKNNPLPTTQPEVEKIRTWDKEPETVFGIKLGGLVANLNLPQCPPLNSAGFHDTKQTSLCIITSRHAPDRMADVFGTPDLSVPYHASLSYYNGRVSGMLLDVKQPDFEKIKGLLIERYGEPTSIDVNDVTSRVGAKLTSQQIQWKGKKISIMALERVGTIDQSYVSFSDTSVLEMKLADQRSNNKKAAEKF